MLRSPSHQDSAPRQIRDRRGPLHTGLLRASELTTPELLRPVGYESMHSGKWHLDSDKQPQPDEHRYDWWFATQNNASPSHKAPQNVVRNHKEVGR